MLKLNRTIFLACTVLVDLLAHLDQSIESYLVSFVASILLYLWHELWIWNLLWILLYYSMSLEKLYLLESLSELPHTILLKYRECTSKFYLTLTELIIGKKGSFDSSETSKLFIYENLNLQKKWVWFFFCSFYHLVHQWEISCSNSLHQLQNQPLISPQNQP